MGFSKSNHQKRHWTFICYSPSHSLTAQAETSRHSRHFVNDDFIAPRTTSSDWQVIGQGVDDMIMLNIYTFQEYNMYKYNTYWMYLLFFLYDVFVVCKYIYENIICFI